VQVRGALETNPSADSDQGLAVMPASVDVVEEPSDPYLY
jgi:hypothetical protein